MFCILGQVDPIGLDASNIYHILEYLYVCRPLFHLWAIHCRSTLVNSVPNMRLSALGKSNCSQSFCSVQNRKCSQMNALESVMHVTWRYRGTARAVTGGSCQCLSAMSHDVYNSRQVTAEMAKKGLDVPSDGFDSIETALDALRQGVPVVVLDDEDRENEGDLIVSGDRVTEETMAFIVRHTSGVICVGMTGEDLDRLDIPLMIPPAQNEEAMSTAFTVTVDLRVGTTTGISAADRTATIRALSSTSSVPEDFKRPGHIFPLRCRHGGVLVRPGHTEASVDLSRLAGCAPAGVLCEIVNDDGTMSRTPELLEFSKKNNLPCITIADLIRYRLKHDTLVERTASGVVHTRYGDFVAHSFTSVLDGQEHVALVYGDDQGHVGKQTMARIQNESILGDLFGTQRCGSVSQLDHALERIVEHGHGVFVYVRCQKGRGMGIAEELKTFHASSTKDTSSPACDIYSSEDGGFMSDLRDHAVAAQILKDVGATSVQLLTNNSSKVDSMVAHGLTVQRIPM